MPPPAEISVPTTSVSSPADNSRPYTLYNITLRLPLRSFVVQKRYSDFHALHATLTSLVGAPPPAPLPPKSWLKSTLTSPELTEDRRLGLERYLRAIAESPDRRWRDTPAWRTFLNLPSTGGSSSAASAAGVGAAPRPTTAAAAADPAVWLDTHRDLRAALHDARLALARRDAAPDHASRAEAGSAAKRALARAGPLLAALTDGLRDGGGGPRPLGDGELRRRRDLLAAARAERDGLDRLSASLAAAAGAGPGGADKAALLGDGGGAAAAGRTGPSSGRAGGGGRVLGAPLPETERTRERDNEGVLLLQRQMMAEQDHDVAALAAIVRRQKEMGLAIKGEVDEQLEYLDRVNEDADRLAGKVGVAKNRIGKLG